MARAMVFQARSLKYYLLLSLVMVVTIVMMTLGHTVHADTVEHTYSGHLRTNDGTPLVNVRVQLDNDHYSVTDATGAFSIVAPPAGNYNVTANYNGLAFSNSGGAAPLIPNGPSELYVTRISHLELMSDVNEDIVIPFVSLTLKTTDYNGNPTPNVPLTLWLLTALDQYLGPNPSPTTAWYGRINHEYYKTDASGSITLKVMQGSMYSCNSVSRIVANFNDGFANACGGVSPYITQDTTMTLQQGTPQSPRNINYRGGAPTNTPYITWDRDTNGYPADHYDVYRDGIKIGSTQTPEYIDHTPLDGEHHYSVKAVGHNGAESNFSQDEVQAIDTVPPVITNASLDKTSIPPGGTMSFSATAADPSFYPTVFPDNGLAEYFIDADPGQGHGTPIQFTNRTTNSVTLADSITPSLPPGPHTLYIRASDRFGNYAIPTIGNWSQPVTLPFVVMLPAPIISTPQLYTNQSPTLQWQAVAGADRYVIYRDGSLVGSSMTTSFTDTAALAEGAYSYTIKAVSSDTEGLPATVMVTYDKTPPQKPTIDWQNNPMQHRDDGSGSADLRVQAADALSPIQKVEYSLNGGPRQALTYQASLSLWEDSISSTLPAGVYNVAVFATDAAGNESEPVNDVLAVYDASNGYVTGHETFIPGVSDVLPIARDTSTKKPTKVNLGFTNVKAASQTAPPSGAFKIQYVIKNNHDEFDIDSTQIDWLVAPAGGTQASMLGHGTLTRYVNKNKEVIQNVAVRIDMTLGANGQPDHVTIKIYTPDTNPSSGSPTWTMDDDASGDVRIRV